MVAELIQVIRERDRVRLLVDGQEVPASAVHRDSVDVPVDPDEVPTVRLELIARRIEVINTLRESEKPDAAAE